MPGLGDILLALTSGASEGYATQVAQQRAAKTKLVMDTLMKYPEAGGDPDFAKLAQSAGIDKDALPIFGKLSSIRAKAMQAQTQAALDQVAKFKQQMSGGGDTSTLPGSALLLAQPPPTVLPAGSISDTYGATDATLPDGRIVIGGGSDPEKMRRAQAGDYNDINKMPGVGPQTRQIAQQAGQAVGPENVHIQPQTPAQTPQRPAPQLAPQVPSRTGVGPDGLPTSRMSTMAEPKISLNIGPKGVSTNVNLGEMNLDEQEQATMTRVSQLQQMSPNTPIGTIIKHVTAVEGRPLKPASENHLLETAGDAVAAHVAQRSGGGADAWLQGVSAAKQQGLRVSQGTMELAGKRSSGEEVSLEARKQMAGVRPSEIKTQFQINAEKASKTVYYNGQPIDPAHQEIASKITSRFEEKMKEPEKVAATYNQLVGLLQAPPGMSDVDALVTFARMAAPSGRVNQAQIEREAKAGVPFTGVLSKFFTTTMKGGILSPEQKQQMADSARLIYTQSQNTAAQHRTQAADQLQKMGIPPEAFLTPGSQVVDPQTGQPVAAPQRTNTPQTQAPTSKPPPSGVDPNLWQDAIRRGLVK